MSTPLHAESTISKLVDALLPRGSSKENPWDEGPSKALYMCLHLRSHV